VKGRHLVEGFDVADEKVELDCPFNDHHGPGVARGDWRIELDASEIVPDNPGEGTPAMVYGPESTSGTYWCVHGTGEIDGWLQLPKDVYDWVAAQLDVINDWLEFHHARLEAAAACDAKTVAANRIESFNDREEG